MARNPRSVRFPPALEEQVQAWADEHRMPFNRAVVELLGRAVAPTLLEAAVMEARQVVAPAIVEIDHAAGSVREVPVKPKSAAELARAAAALAEGKGKEVTPDWRKK